MSTASVDGEGYGPFGSSVVYVRDVLAESPRIWKILGADSKPAAMKRIHLGYVQKERGTDHTNLRPYLLIAMPNEFELEYKGVTAYRTSCSVSVYFTDLLRKVAEESYLEFLKFGGTILQTIVEAQCNMSRRMSDVLIGVQLAMNFQRTDPDMDGTVNTASGAGSALEGFWEGMMFLTFK